MIAATSCWFSRRGVRKKTDRRDANALGNLLWVNRSRLLAGQNMNGLRRVVIPGHEDEENRQLTALRKRMGSEGRRFLRDSAVRLE